jgi:hypothetical protein
VPPSPERHIHGDTPGTDRQTDGFRDPLPPGAVRRVDARPVARFTHITCVKGVVTSSNCAGCGPGSSGRSGNGSPRCSEQQRQASDGACGDQRKSKPVAVVQSRIYGPTGGRPEERNRDGRLAHQWRIHGNVRRRVSLPLHHRQACGATDRGRLQGRGLDAHRQGSARWCVAGGGCRVS